MPASEDFYRDQKKLHVVFLISALGLFGATIWMMAADHIREWKDHQYEFTKVKDEKLRGEFNKQSQDFDKRKLADLDKRLADAKKTHEAQSEQLGKLEGELSALQPVETTQNTTVAFLKADLAQTTSQYDAAISELGTATDAQRIERIKRARDAALNKITQLTQKLDEANKSLTDTKRTIKEKEAEIADMDRGVLEIQEAITKYTSDIDRIQRQISENVYGWDDQLRAIPILDGFASPVRVKQVVLEDLPIDYNFKYVTRFDRCQTCHLGIDQPGFTKQDNVLQPFLSHPRLDLFVGPDSPHPVEKFGCTICHQGQGTATSFDWASHTPADTKTEKEWTEEYGWFYNHFHEQPMLPNRFIESSCLKCHHDPFQIPEAEQLLTGFKTVRTYGCFGCHEINGFDDDGVQFGPNLRLTAKGDSPEAVANSLRKVGPSLLRVSDKLDKEFVLKWVRDPLAFRPTTRMPQYYDQIDSGFFGDAPPGEFSTPHTLENLSYAEIYAITAYLFDQSKKNIDAGKLPAMAKVEAAGDAKRGKELFLTKGCVACHNHKDTAKEFVAKENSFGPDLSNVAAKFTSKEQRKWLASWINNPAAYNPHTYMPNLQLSAQDSADIAEYLVSVPGEWAKELPIPALDNSALRDLLLAIESKGTDPQQAEKKVDNMSTQDQLVLLGEKTISRLGCFGCHEITGFDQAKPIGVALSDWGKKDPHKLAFENVIEYVEEQVHEADEKGEKHFYKENDYYTTQMHHHQREGFLMQKLREPRSYDYKKLRAWQDRARMPKFNFNDQQREAVATFVLGLMAEKINPKFVYNPGPEGVAEYQGLSLLNLYNCTACHVIKPGEYAFSPAPEMVEQLVALGKKEMSEDYDFPGHSAWSVPKLNAGTNMTIHGLPAGGEDPEEAEDPTDPRRYFVLWAATSLKDQVLPAGVRVAVPQSQLRPGTTTDPYGGVFALQLVDYLVGKSSSPANPAERDKAWQQSPPPLIREGEKVQTPWLYQFLRDPQMIRPAVALRMPKFNYRDGDVETLANYFAAADGVPYPYLMIPERESQYIDEMNAQHPQYLEDAFRLITNKDLCIKCHPVGGYKPLGKPEELGPALVRAPERLRPEWMQRWIANPRRLVPYTGMPVNFPKTKEQFQELFKGSGMAQIVGVRDALVNYGRVVDLILSTQRAEAEKVAPEAPKQGD